MSVKVFPAQQERDTPTNTKKTIREFLKHSGMLPDRAERILSLSPGSIDCALKGNTIELDNIIIASLKRNDRFNTAYRKALRSRNATARRHIKKAL